MQKEAIDMVRWCWNELRGGRNYNMLYARYSLMGFLGCLGTLRPPSRRAAEPIRADWFTIRRKFLEVYVFFFFYALNIVNL